MVEVELMTRRFAEMGGTRRQNLRERVGPSAPVVTYQSILSALLLEMWDSQFGISLVSGNVNTWTGQIAGRVQTAPAPGNRPPYGVDTGFFLGKSLPLFANPSSLQILGGSALYVAGTRPWWCAIGRFTATMGAATQTILSTLNTAQGTLNPSISRTTAGSASGFYFPGTNTVGPTIDQAVHMIEVFSRVSDTLAVNSLDGVDTVGASLASGVAGDCNNIYFGNDRGSQYAPYAVSTILCCSVAPSPTQRAAVLALARSSNGF